MRFASTSAASALPVAHDDARLAQLLGEDVANLIENLEDGANLDLAFLAVAQDRLGLLDPFCELVEEFLDTCIIHEWAPSLSSLLRLCCIPDN